MRSVQEARGGRTEARGTGSRARPYWFAGIVLVAALGAGCGYTLAGRGGGRLPEGVRVVAVPLLGNATPYLRIEQVLTEKLRTELIGRGRYRVVTEAQGADAVLTGAITGVALEPVGFTDAQRASRYLVTLTLRAQLTAADGGETLWSSDAMTFREEYDLATQGLANLGGEVFVDQERSAFDRVATDVARRVVTAMLEAF